MRAMNIVVVIKQQHEEFRHLIDQVTEAASKDTPEQMRLFREVRSKLNAHGRAEERVLFPRMEEDERTRQAALEAEEWHAASRNVMSKLAELAPEDELWMPKWLVFSGIILAHLDAEEERALGRLDKTFDEEELERLGRDFLAAEEGIMAESSK